MAGPFDNTNPLFRPFLAPSAASSNIPFLAPTPVAAQPALSTAISMPSALPASISAPIAPASVMKGPPSASELARASYTHAVDSRAGVDNISNPLVRGIARAGDVLGSVFAPRVSQFIPGTTLNHEREVGIAASRAKTAEDQEQAAADLETSQAHAKQQESLASQEAAKAESLRDPRKAVDPSKTVQTDDGVYQLNPDTGKYDLRVGDRVEKPKSPEQQVYDSEIASGKTPAQAFTTVNQAKNTKDASFQQQFLDAYKIAHPNVSDTDAISATIRATSTQPKIEVHAANAPAGSTGTWSPGFDANKNPVMFNSKTGEVKPMTGGFTKTTGASQKIGSDEQKRADLAQNLNENIDSLEDIAHRRPELFGPLAGRYTELRNAVGTSDADITKLEAIKHNLGMVSQGAHGMRSAEGVERAAHSLLNGFHNSPDATIQGLEAARRSVQTFLNDSQNPGKPRTGGDSSSNIQVFKDGDTVYHIPANQVSDFKKDHPNAR